MKREQKKENKGERIEGMGNVKREGERREERKKKRQRASDAGN